MFNHSHGCLWPPQEFPSFVRTIPIDNPQWIIRNQTYSSASRLSEKSFKQWWFITDQNPLALGSETQRCAVCPRPFSKAPSSHTHSLPAPGPMGKVPPPGVRQEITWPLSVDRTPDRWTAESPLILWDTAPSLQKHVCDWTLTPGADPNMAVQMFATSR